jgi:hypothetical protein
MLRKKAVKLGLGLKSLLREAKNGNIGAVIKLFQAYIRRK